MAKMRSIRNGSVSGMAQEASTTSRSMFATAGRRKELRRGKIASTVPFPFASTVISTKSPTSGVTPSLRKRPRARHSTTPSGVWT